MNDEQQLGDRFRGCLLGLAVGDAVGTTVEFKPRGSFCPVTDMDGGGPFGLKPGQWTDDTSMALCLAESLIEKQGFDPMDQMERYLRWYRQGHLSSTGACFDIGNATSSALNQFERTGDPISGSTDPHSAGNGSIMRLAPVPMFFYPDAERAALNARESSRTTHGADECLDACGLYAYMLVVALDGKRKKEILLGSIVSELMQGLSPKIQAIADCRYKDKVETEIRGSGYVVESLEAARMKNCVTDYAQEITDGECAIYHVQYRGRPYTMEVIHGPKKTLRLGEVAGLSNRKAPARLMNLLEGVLL